MKQRIRVRGDFSDTEFIRSDPHDSAIDYSLMERVDYIVSDTMLHDESFKYTQEELVDLTAEYRVAMNMDKKQLAVFLCACIDKFPYLVYQGLAENHMTLKRGNKE